MTCVVVVVVCVCVCVRVLLDRCARTIGEVTNFVCFFAHTTKQEGSSGQQHTSLGAVTEPVDTIFVKSVRENGPAARAGLCVGKKSLTD